MHKDSTYLARKLEDHINVMKRVSEFAENRISNSETLKARFNRLQEVLRLKLEQDVGKAAKVFPVNIDTIDSKVSDIVAEDFLYQRGEVSEAKKAARPLYRKFHPDLADRKELIKWFPVLKQAADSGDLEIVHLMYIISETPSDITKVQEVTKKFNGRVLRAYSSQCYLAYADRMRGKSDEEIDNRILRWLNSRIETCFK